MELYVLFIGSPGSWTILGVIDNEEQAIGKMQNFILGHVREGTVQFTMRDDDGVIKINPHAYIECNGVQIWTFEIHRKKQNEIDWSNF